MSWIFNTKAVPGTNPWSWEWGTPNSFADRSPRVGGRWSQPHTHQAEAPVASAHGYGHAAIMRPPTEAMRKQRADLVAFNEEMRSGKHSTLCAMRRDARENLLPVKSKAMPRPRGSLSVPPPPGLNSNNALNLEASKAVKDLMHKQAFMPAACPKAAPPQFVGAEVSVKPDVGNTPAVPAQSSVIITVPQTPYWRATRMHRWESHCCCGRDDPMQQPWDGRWMIVGGEESYKPCSLLFGIQEPWNSVGELRWKIVVGGRGDCDADGNIHGIVQNQSGADPAAMQCCSGCV